MGFVVSFVSVGIADASEVFYYNALAQVTLSLFFSFGRCLTRKPCMFDSPVKTYAVQYIRSNNNVHRPNQSPVFRGSKPDTAEPQVSADEETFMRETAAIAKKIQENDFAIDQLRVKNAESKKAKGIEALKRLLQSIQRSSYTKESQKTQIRSDIAKKRTPSIDERTAKKKALRAENEALDAQLQGYVDRFESSSERPEEKT